jgi:GrpB-like predicted nucleotidyltransferase (UPF0157 family)
VEITQRGATGSERLSDVEKTREIVIVDATPAWADEFQGIAQSLRHALGDLALRIDHIGSTSVPGLAAKEVIDVQVTVRDLSAELAARFAQAGYVRRVEVTHDHRPPNAPGPDSVWEKQYYQPAPPARRTHIHVRRAGSANGRYALLFRDYLRTHPLAAAAYAQVKQALARQRSSDWSLYYEVKDPVCDIIMAGAEDWAEGNQWRTDYYDDAPTTAPAAESERGVSSEETA